MDPSRRSAGSNIAGVDLDVPHVDLARQSVLERMREPRDRVGQLVRQPLGDIEQVDPTRAADIGGSNWRGPTWRSPPGGWSEPASRGQGKSCCDCGLACARLAEQEKHTRRL